MISKIYANGKDEIEFLENLKKRRGAMAGASRAARDMLKTIKRPSSSMIWRPSSFLRALGNIRHRPLRF